MAALVAALSVLMLRLREGKRASLRSTCLYCGSAAIRRSVQHGPFDRLLERWHCRPFRCEVCFVRHYRLDRD